jgi:hypothetical protein
MSEPIRSPHDSDSDDDLLFPLRRIHLDPNINNSPLPQLTDSASSSGSSNARAPNPPSFDDIEITDRAVPDYYYGLPSNPPLLASTIASARPIRSSDKRVSKHLFPIENDHPLTSVWEPKIGPFVMGLIDRLVPPSEACIDAVAIGPDQGKAVPTIWIGVIAGIITKEVGAEMVRAAKDYCVELGVVAIEVEIRTTHVSLLSKLLDITDFPESMSKLVDPYCWTVGTPISSADLPANAFGTGGLFVRIPDCDNLLMLTAQHCVARKERTSQQPGDASAGIEISLSTPLIHARDLELAKKQIKLSEAALARQVKKQKSQTEKGLETKDVDSHVVVAKTELKARKAWHKQLEKEFGHPKTRIMGRTHGFPARKCDIGPKDPITGLGYTQDWATIRTDLDANSKVTNVLNLRDPDDISLVTAREDKAPSLPSDFDDQDLRIKGVMAPADFRKGPQVVIKRGQSTKLTVGLTLVQKSFHRNLDTNGLDYWSQEIPIIAIPKGDKF